MLLQTLVLLGVVHAHAASPERAALSVMYSNSKTAPIVRRVNIVGPYAAVLTSGGLMESSPVREAILVERFSFGWQALEILNASCRLRDHALGKQTEHRLMLGMPIPSDNGLRMCSGRKDAGPPDDIEKVRRLVDGPLVPSVIVSDGWAVAEWYGAGGGMSLWSKHNGEWRLVQGGGGAMGVSEMRRYGVPESDWCKFGIAGAKCH